MQLYPVQLVLLMLSALGDTLIVAAPAKLALFDKGKLLVLLTHTSAGSAHAAAAAAIVAHQLPSAVSTTSIRAVHNSEPVVTHTVTEILHPAPDHPVAPHHPHPQHPASTVNGHSLGYAGPTHLVVTPLAHASVYSLHVGGFGVGLHFGGHGHGHGYYTVV